ncbi:hypothetical protein AYO20_09811 [Fonsecaea nubica]|uniref:Uncharacterized protein n=1 Tax=Fonsecaea nubica TaxID=856822 RepID=A0A178CDV3_9EURO|nr:hypothetical protein AYO20_09811 [Fonsecaea nubica]OAL27213.1 hypothetical protein AYO20_09811 [Fonsecaea nubica]
MAGVAVAAASPPMPLALRLRLSQFHLCFKIRGDDEMASELVTFVDDFLRKRRAFHGNKLPALGEVTGHDTVEISAPTASGQTALVAVHQRTLPPVYVDVPQRVIIELPGRQFVFVILRVLRSSGNGKKAKLQCVKKVELVTDWSVTLKEMLPHANTSTSHISSALVRTRANELAGVAMASGQHGKVIDLEQHSTAIASERYGTAISSILSGPDLDVDVVLK